MRVRKRRGINTYAYPTWLPSGTYIVSYGRQHNKVGNEERAEIPQKMWRICLHGLRGRKATTELPIRYFFFYSLDPTRTSQILTLYSLRVRPHFLLLPSLYTFFPRFRESAMNSPLRNVVDEIKTKLKQNYTNSWGIATRLVVVH